MNLNKFQIKCYNMIKKIEILMKFQIILQKYKKNKINKLKNKIHYNSNQIKLLNKIKINNNNNILQILK